MQKILYVDMDNVLVNFQSGIDQVSTEIQQTYAGRLDEVPGIFSLMAPKEGALEAYQRLSKHYETYILSTAPWENPSAWSDKLLWVKRYLGQEAFKRLILSHNKHLNYGDYLIDDRLANGADRFSGELILFGGVQFPHWQSVTEYLLP